MGKKVQIGKTDLFVSPLGLGTNAVGGHNIFPDCVYPFFRTVGYD